MSGEPKGTEAVGQRYRVERALGKGGMATVYAVTDERSGARVALKQLAAKTLTEMPRAGLLFQREFHTLTQLRHPHIVEAYDYGLDTAGPYYTMELLEGSDLRDLAPCDWRLVARILRQAATALALLHSRRLIHRDLSPRNLWRTPEGALKLIDFGAMGTQGALSMQLIGTPPFTAPEVYHRQMLDPRTDLYALGAIGYWLLTGAHAYPASRFRSLPQVWQRGAPVLRAPAGELPDALVQLVRSLMSLEMLARPRCAAEVIERLDALLDEPHTPDPAVADGYLITPALAGRAGEMARLTKRLSALEAGNGGAVVIEGVAGSGRTRLLQEVGLAAKLAGAQVIQASSHSHAGQPYAVARTLAADWQRSQPQHGRETLPTDIRELLGEPLDSVTSDPRERRSRLLGSLSQALLYGARDAPLVITVDDAEQADDASLWLLAALAVQGRARQLLVVLTVTAGASDSPPLGRLRSDALCVDLPPLSESATRELVGSIFGDAPHVARLSTYVHQQARGNVLLTVESLRELVQRGAIRYADGSWVIPREVQSLPSGARLQDAFGERIASLPADARELAELWALSDGELALERALPVFCAGLGERGDGQGAVRFFDALDALVYAEVLSGADGDYDFRQEGLRKAVLEALPAERTVALNRRIGEQLLLAGSALAPPQQLRAAWHLMRGGARREGAELVVKALYEGRLFIELAEGTVDALVEALRIHEELGGPRAEGIRLRVCLMRCAYYYDTDLAELAWPVLEQLARDSGVTDARELPDSVPETERFGRGFAVASARFEAASERERGLPPIEALSDFVQAVLSAVGVAILRFDVDEIGRLLGLLAPLSGFGPDNALSVGNELTRTVLLAMRGQELVAGDSRIALLEHLQDPTCYAGLSDGARGQILATQLHAQGMVEASWEPERALERAAAIDRLGLQMYRGAALQIRFIVELYRGRADRAAAHRDGLDLVSMQEGSGRQTELWLVRYLILPYMAWGDVLALRQTVQQLQELTERYPAYAPFLSIALGALHSERGEHDEAIASIEHAISLAPAGAHAAWAMAVIVHVQVLVGAKQYARALEVAELVFVQAVQEGVHVERLKRTLVPTLALARAACGDASAAEQELDGLIERARREREGDLSLARLDEYRAQVAALRQDGARFGANVQKMGEHARSCANPTLISRYELLQQDATRNPDAVMELDSSTSETMPATRAGARGRTSATPSESDRKGDSKHKIG